MYMFILEVLTFNKINRLYSELKCILVNKNEV